MGFFTKSQKLAPIEEKWYYFWPAFVVTDSCIFIYIYIYKYKSVVVLSYVRVLVLSSPWKNGAASEETA